MSVDVPRAEEEEEGLRGSLDPAVDELLRRLLVGGLRLKVDPVSGRVLPGQDADRAQDHP